MKNRQQFKLIVFDVDGTLTRELSIWEFIHKELGKWYGFAEEYQRKFLAGEISYQAFCDLDARVWKGMTVQDLEEIAKRVPFHSGAEELIRYFKRKYCKIAIVSSGLSILSNWVHQRFGFDYSVSNELLHEDGRMTGEVRIRVPHNKKGDWVKKIQEEFGVSFEQTIALGDSSGDIDMFKAVGFSIAFNSSCKELNQIASLCVESRNLADIIPRLPF